MKLQITLDTYSIEDGISLVRGIADSIDVVEVGTPLLLQVGMDAVTQVKSAFPDLEVLADTKIWHNGARIADCAFEHGADMVTILAGATDREVETVVAVAEQRGAKVAADMAGVEGLVQRSAELEDLGVTPIEAVGQEFDPSFHNAVMQVESDEYPSGTVAQEFQKGYKYHDSVIRYSMVGVVQ